MCIAKYAYIYIYKIVGSLRAYEVYMIHTALWE